VDRVTGQAGNFGHFRNTKKNLGLDVGEVPKSLANIQTLNF
jgi:hypothetical protein